MGLKLEKQTEDILDLVKEKSGKGIEFIEREDIGGDARVKIARERMPKHIVFYSPKHSELLNHLIAHECGHILRMSGVPVNKRMIPITNKETKRKALEQIQEEITQLSQRLPEDKLVFFVNYVYEGLIRQLTNYPPDIMIEKWIYDEYPDLRGYQKRTIEKQRNEIEQVLSEEVGLITPKTIYEASNLMNYAYFRILGFHIKENFISAFSNTPYLNKGKRLAKITTDDYHNNYEGDVEMIDRWAWFLNVEGWYKWGDFEDTPDNYETSLS